MWKALCLFTNSDSPIVVVLSYVPFLTHPSSQLAGPDSYMPLDKNASS